MGRHFAFLTLSITLLSISDGLSATRIEPHLIVDQLGSLRGSWMTSSSGKTISAFRGIPYAKAPVDVLRFSDPVPFGAWYDERNATADGPCCMQTVTSRTEGRLPENEDCLYLNIYTRLEAHNWPVMVFIHGGAFTSGCGHSTKEGPQYLLDENVVLVTINYRLGIFGFLTTEDAVAPGSEAHYIAIILTL